MLGFFFALVERDCTLLNSSSKASHLLESLGINKIPSKEGPEVRRIEWMMICLCILDVFDRLFVRSPLGVERIQHDHVQGSRCDQLSSSCGMVTDSRRGKMITRAAASGSRDGVEGFILHKIASECEKFFHKS